MFTRQDQVKKALERQHKDAPIASSIRTLTDLVNSAITAGKLSLFNTVHNVTLNMIFDKPFVKGLNDCARRK